MFNRWCPWLFSGFVTLLIIVGVAIIEFERKTQQTHLTRSDVLLKLTTLRAGLEGVAHHNLILNRQIAAYISVNPDITQDNFIRMARVMLVDLPGIQCVSFIKNRLITYTYPPECEWDIGSDILSYPELRSIVMRVMETRQSVVHMMQGGRFIISHMPVFYLQESEIPFTSQDIVSIIIDSDHLFKKADVFGRYPDLRLALKGKDRSGFMGEVIFGDSEVFNLAPEVVEISFPGGDWQLAAAPKLGWGKIRPNALWFIGGALSIFAGGLVRLFIRDHLRLHKEIHDRNYTEERIKQSNEILTDILSASPVGIGLIKNGFFEWVNGEMRKMFGFENEEDYRDKSGSIIFPSIESYEKTIRTITSELTSGKPPRLDTLFQRKDKSTFFGHIKLSCTCPTDPMERAVFTISDISWRKQAEEDRLQKEKIQSVLEIASTVCNELSQPMMVISGYADLLLMDIPVDHPYFEKVTKIKKQIERLYNIAGKLMRITSDV